MSLAAFKSLYRDSGIVHLNNAGMAPPHPILAETISGLLQKLHRNGCHNLAEEFKVYMNSLASFGRLIGCEAAEVAMMSTCAVAISQAAFGIPLSPGEEVLTWDQEYPSNAYPWLVRTKEVGAKVIAVKSETDLSVTTEKLIEAITPQTRIIAVSWVQYQTGAITDLRKVVEAVKGKNIWIVVDLMQGLGVLPFHMGELGVDVVCGATQKWMCGPVGHGFIAVKRERIPELRPLFYGAMTFGTSEDVVDATRAMRTDARRFEPGAPLVLGAVGAAAVIVEFLKMTIPQISQEAVRLADQLQEGLEKRGARVLRQIRPGILRSPIVTAVPTKDFSKIEASLHQSKITFAKRAEGFRFSPHAFNDDQDLERVLKAWDQS